jgi:hypothetical protein
MDDNSPCFNHKDNDAGEIRQRVCLNRDYLDFAGATLLPLPE